MEPERTATLAPDVAGFGARFGARTVDGLILVVPQLVLWSVLGLSGGAILAISAVVSAAYEIPQLALRGQTVGKRLFGVRVVSIHGGGNPLWPQAFVRWALPSILAVSPAPALRDVAGLWAIAVYLPLFFDPFRRGLHDRAAGTRAVRDA